MKIAILSDVHANLEALAAVLDDATARGAERLWCLGDSVGYGPDPAAVLAILRGRDALIVAGNHDLVACGRMDVDDFNPAAAAAALWTRDILDESDRAFLASLPLVTSSGDFTLVHGTLRHPEWEYLLAPEQAAAHFALQQTPYSLVGHTHLPMVAREDADGPKMARLAAGQTVPLGPQRLILNPGGAGQPRDGDPTAPYMLYDAGAASIALHRVPYDFATTGRKIRAIGLPEPLAARLERGL